MDEVISSSKVSKRHSISHLMMSERLEEAGSSRLVLGSILSLSVVFIVLIIWAGIVQVDEVATGTGEIVPYESIKPIQHLEGGIVFSVYVKDGSVVSKGDKLFELSPEPDTSDLKRLKKRHNSLEIEIFRLQAMLNEAEIGQDEIFSAITYKEVTEPSLLRLQLSNAQMLHQQNAQRREYNRAQLASRLEQEKTNLKNIEKQIFHITERKKLLDDEVAIFNALAAQKATSKINLLNTQDRLQEVVGDLLTIVREKTTIESTILDLENQLKTLEYNQENQALEELNDATAELLEVREQISRAQVRVDRLLVRAPVEGVVKGLSMSPGDVIAPAEILFEIVPLTKHMMAEIRITTEDIGHVEVGDKVHVKVSTYDFATYGQIGGTLISISPSTFLDEENNPYYKSVIELEKNYLGDNPEINQIFPGMTVIADVKTGKKSLLRYMLKPINRTFYDAFTER